MEKTETLTDSESIDSKQQKTAIYGYHHDYNMYPDQPTPGYPIPQYYHLHHSQNYPSQSFHIHETYSKSGPQYPLYPAGYYDDYNRQQTLIHEPNGTTPFGRLMLILMIVLIGSMCMMSLVMWFLYGSYIPEFEVETLRVSNFSATGAALSGTWEADIVVRNTNQDLTVDFTNVRSAVLYKGNVLGLSNLRGFGVEKNKEFDLSFAVAAVDDRTEMDEVPGGGGMEGWVMAALARDWDNGAVVFGLRLAMSANFSSTERGYRQESLIVSCENLEVTSSPAAREGTLSRGVGSECLISI